MTRAASQHLSEGELEALLDASAHPELGAGGTVPHVPEEVCNHLALCKACEQKLDMYRAARNALRGARLAKTNKPPGRCADEEVWAEIAAGVHRPEESLPLLEHAARCDRCGVLLTEALASMYDEPAVEEEAMLSGLKSQERQWAENLAPKLKQAAQTEQKPVYGRNWWNAWFRPPTLVFALFTVLAAIVGWKVARYHPEQKAGAVTLEPAPARGGLAAKAGPGTLVARAYRDYRTMEFRIAGAQFAPMHSVERGAAPSIADLPSSILDATKSVREALERNSTDPQLLDARAQLELLDGQPGRAIESLEKAREKAPDSPAVLVDLASAYMISADQSDARSKQGLALNLLGQVLHKSPNDTVALYNYALVLEKLHLYGEAIKTWNRFSEIETDQNWKKDGLEHRNYLVQHRLSEDRFKNPAGHAPGAALQDLLHRSKRSRESDVDALQDEFYLADALADWIPAVGESAAGERSRDSALALTELAKVFRDQHHDAFLADLLSGPHGLDWTQGMRDLAAAVRANARGEPEDVVTHAERAIARFHRAGNKAGEAAARFEWLSGINRSQKADRCAAVAGTSLNLPDLLRYPWIKTELLFESSTCDFMSGRQEEALDQARRAARVASQSRYKVLSLQAMFVLDGVSTPWVASRDAWNRISAGLDEFWHHPYPPEAGEGFYTDLGYAAQSEGWWFCAEAVFRESVAIHSSHGDASVAAAAHHLLAKAAEAAGDEQTAEVEYREAASLLGRLGKDKESAQLELTIEQAAVEVRRDHLADAEATLKEVAPKLGLVSNHYALIPYLESAGELHRRTGNPRLAEQELWKAIHLIEQDTNSLRSEPDLLTWHRDTSQAYRSLLRLYLDAYRQEERTLSFLEWYRALPLRRALLSAQDHPANGASEEMEAAHYLTGRTAIDPRSGVLTWIAFPDSLAIFLLDQRGLHVARVALRKEDLDLTAQRLTRLCADPRSDIGALNRGARQLYAWLLEPLELYLDGIETLTIEPDEGMEAIPFQVLRTGKGEYLGSRMAILESPGLGYAQMERADKRITRGSVMLAVGDPLQSGAARLLPLPDASREAADIASLFDHHFLFTGKQAMLAKVSQRLPEADVFHFAGHAISARNETGLVLAPTPNVGGMPVLDREKLSLENLNRLKLVVMSGCETGIADAGLIDPGNLVRVFLRAGVPDVVASKWKVDSEMTARLLEDTYQGILRGQPVETAIAAAESSFREAGAHPYYWAAFSVFGR